MWLILVFWFAFLVVADAYQQSIKQSHGSLTFHAAKKLPISQLPMMASLLLSLLLAFLIAASPAAVIGQPKQTNITLGSSLPASINSSWFSPSGRFAFGFYPKAEGFAVGVWLATSPERTVVWTANRDDPPIMDGSIWLTFDGRLIWNAPAGQEKVICQPADPAAMAAMLDTGNFVLYNSQQVIVWSTFSSPTDTLLPGQSLLPETQLFSSISETDRSTGRYRLNNQKDGNIVLYPVDTTDTIDDAYWDTNTFQIGFPLTLNLDSNGTMYLAGNNGNFTKNLAPARNSSSRSGDDIYYRVTVDPDGILRLYLHSFGKNGSSTTVEWAALDNRCLVRGVCGINSYCSLKSNGEPNCLCPPGFEFVDPSQILLGCMRNSSVGDCLQNSSGANTGSTMVTMRNTTWVDRPYSVLPSTTSMDDCKAACLADCFCEAVLFKENTCTKQVIPLNYGRTGSNDILFIKVGTINPNQRGAIYQRNRKVRIDVLVVSIVLAASSAVVFAVASFLFFRNRKLGRYTRASECSNSGLGDETPLRSYSYEELERATDSFREELGRGAFGTVFKGALSNNGERIIAVKRLEKMVEEGEMEFQREVRAIGRTHHRNLVRLLGFCNEASNRLLVYEYVSNGSLANLLFKSETYPSWEKRVRIALDVARGLQYLHEELEAHIIHCDIKPQNILMDSSGTAKIADFGLAKLLMPDQTRTFTGVRGTRGYLAPEWYKNAPITVKADVYSYGIVLFEIICCKRNMELEEAGHDHTLSEWVYECLRTGELDNLKIDEVVDNGELERMVKVGLWCVQNELVFRPSMKNVILMLEGNMEVSLPPPPPSFSV